MAAEKSTATTGTTTTTETSLIDEILQETRKSNTNAETIEQYRQGIHELVARLVKPTERAEKIDNAYVDRLIAEIDGQLSAQIDEVLHHPEFQKLEAAWTALEWTIKQIDYKQNIRTELLNVSKKDLLSDFEDAPELTKSGFYRIVYTAEYGQLGGKPYGAVFSNYEVDAGPQDITLLQKVAAVSAMAHAPFFASASPQFFGEEDFLKLPNLKDLDALFEGPQYAKWRSFRETEDSRYIGILLPKFLLRLPYGPKTIPVSAFNYEEKVADNHRSYLWGNATHAFATRIASAFAQYRWCANIIGPQAGGTVENLPLHAYEAMGAQQLKIPTEIMISDALEVELSNHGFIALTYRKDSDNAVFFSANSVQKPKTFGQSPEGKEAELNYKLGTQLPYLFVANRIGHYLKVIQREQLGTFKERADLERELNDWIRQYVSDMEAPTALVRAKRPLRQAHVSVADVPGDAGWYRVELQVRPHFKYMGAYFTLSLVGKLDKKAA